MDTCIQSNSTTSGIVSSQFITSLGSPAEGSILGFPKERISIPSLFAVRGNCCETQTSLHQWSILDEFAYITAKDMTDLHTILPE
jgi:hypothetical protein